MGGDLQPQLTPDAIVQWNGTGQPTTVNSSNSLTVSVPASLNVVGVNNVVEVNPHVSHTDPPATFTVYPSFTFALSPSTVAGGTNVTGTVTLSGPTPANMVMRFTSDNAAASVPATVTIPSGASSGTVTITTTSVSSSTTANITAKNSNITLTQTLTVTPSPALAAPTNLVATAGDNQVVLTWAGSTGATGYNVYRGGSLGLEDLNNPLNGATPLASNVRTYTDSTAIDGTPYYYVVRALNANGESPISNEAGTTPHASSAADPFYHLLLNGTNGANVNITQGTGNTISTGMTSLSIASLNGFSGNVSLTATGLPAGVTISFSPSTVSIVNGGVGTSNIAVNVNSAARPGYYTLMLKGASGNSADYASLNLAIYPAVNSLKFTLASDPDFVETNPGATEPINVTLTTLAGFSGSVSFGLSDDPSIPILSTISNSAKVSYTFSPASLNSTGTISTLTFQIGSQVPPGDYHLLITGTNSAGTQTTPFTLTVYPDFSNAVSDLSTTTQIPSATPSPLLASSVSDMVRQSYDGSGNVSMLRIKQPAQYDPFYIQQLMYWNNLPQPNFVGAHDDRIYLRKLFPSPGAIQYPYSAVCKISVIFPDGGTASGSGTLVGKNHVLTAAHVLFDPKGIKAMTVYVYPAYDNGPSRVYPTGVMIGSFIPRLYQNEVAQDAANGDVDATANANDDDWALLNLATVTKGPNRGKGLGEVANYMIMSDDFTDPDQETTIAGYPGDKVNGVSVVGAPRDYLSYVGNGDDGQVTNLFRSMRYTDRLFYTIDVSEGDSGAGLWHVDPSGEDGQLHVYGVVNGDLGVINDAAPITTRRLQILKNVMSIDHNDVSY